MTVRQQINARLKARIASGRALVLPGVPNALTARIAEDAGFEALYLTGAGVSNTNLGVPDIGITTLSDTVDALLAIRNVVKLPIVVDADTGFGNAVNVYNTVRRLEWAGASALQLEDQLSPKRCGHFDGQQVITVTEMVGKIRAAVDARCDANFQIIARTDARASEGFEAAVARANAYIEAGADITFVEALATEAEMRALPNLLNRPQLVNIVHGGKTPPLSLEQLEGFGFSIVLYANAALQAAIASMQIVLGDLARTGSLNGVTQYLASFSDRQRVVQKDFYDALDKRYASHNMEKHSQ